MDASKKMGDYDRVRAEIKRSQGVYDRLGERADTILGVGCPSSDIARQLDRNLRSEVVNSTGSGSMIDVSQPYLLVLFHPTTTEFGGERRQMDELLEGLRGIERETILLWANIDAGSDHVDKAIRSFRQAHSPTWLRTLININPEDYLRVLANAACAVGNSSSFVRDASYFGTPVVLIGNRQRGRETDEHVVNVPPERASIAAAIQRQIQHGHYAPSKLYGDGYVSDRIANALANATLYVQKQLSYVEAPEAQAFNWRADRAAIQAMSIAESESVPA